MNTSPSTFHPSPSRPHLALPKGACDAHCHIFGPTAVFPFAADARFRPGDAPKEALFSLHEMLGIERCVVVQSGCHGFDNSVVTDALAARPGRYLGIALLPADVEDAEIRRLDAQGFRGIRFNYMPHLDRGASADELRSLSPRLAEYGWHLQIHMDSTLIDEMAPILSTLPVPVVIDHMGRIDASKGLDQPPFVTLMGLMERPNFWVKVCGCERASRQDESYRDATPFAHRLVSTYPDRVLWGTDWPHPNLRTAPPDDGVLVDLLEEIAPSDDLMKRLLVDNPTRLYRFAV